ncbi:hypothetical protein ACX9R5_07160 [Rathayibacter sp. CAU 1779]
MSIGTLLLLSAVLGANFAETYALATYRRAVRGSHQRYVWRSRYVLLACVVAVLSTVIAIIDVAGGDTVFATLWLAIAAMRVVALVLNRDKDDDDWFKRTGRAIRKGVKKVVAALTPAPGSAAPVPA